jgi:ABC-type multidrug transport system fused ATPase/permease subunit
MRATRKLGIFLKPYWRWAVLAPLLMAIEVTMDLTQPRLIQRIVDQGIARSDMGVVVYTGLWMLGAALLGLAAGVGCGVFTVLASQSFGADLRGTLFRKVQALSFGNLDRLETGGLITRLTNDVTQVQEAVMMLLRVMVRVPLLLIGSLIMAILTSPQLALIFLVLIPVVLVALIWIINKTFPMFGEVQQRLDALNTVMQENLAGVRVVKAFARASHELRRFGRANDRLMDQNIAAVRMSAVTMPFMMLALNAGVVAAIGLGGVQVSAGGLHVGQLIAFINYLMQTLMSLMMISMLVVRFARSEASAERLQEVLDSEPELRNSPDMLAAFAPQGRLVFENVSFSYGEAGPKTEDQRPEVDNSAWSSQNGAGKADSALGLSSLVLKTEDQRPEVDNSAWSSQNGAGKADSAPDLSSLVLKDVSFTVEPGQTVALLGATGAGKSSLVNLIPRFYDVTGGRITIDGVDVRAIDEATLRGVVGAALQESVLFTGTIRDNIRYGRPDATDAEVVAAATLAQADDFISRFPEGYDSLVGQRGVNLSGGQKQRIAIARALLTKPAVLILDSSNRELRQAATRAQIFAGLIGPMMNCVNNLGLAIVAGTGGWMAVQGLATVGTIASFINYTRQFGRPLNELATLYSAIQSAVAGAERVFAVIDEAPEIDVPDALPLGQIRGEVAFEDVSFSYAPDVPVLKRVSLRAEPGQIVALVGPTGAGKTTIVNLLTRFYDIDSGRISIDGQDLGWIKKDDLRRQLGIVLQDTFLFAGSVMDNIRYGRLDAADDEVIAAAKLANADQFIHRLPHGYATPLSERGSNLSQGQRQLLAIARALLANPSILILDEATSSVDTRTEQHIQAAMLRLMAGRTSFVIAHRLSTIRDADQILVINHGEIVERGTHQELLGHKGFYHHLYTSQFGANAQPAMRADID